MTRTQRILAVALSGALMLGGFAIGRVTDVPKTSAEENQLASNRATLATNPVPGANQAFNSSDYKAGYSDGYGSCLNNRATSVSNTSSTNYNDAGYNEGYRAGYAEAYRERTGQQVTSAFAPGRTVVAPVRMSYRPVVYRERRHSSKLRTALTIAAPAAIGAGIGLAAGGGKGAGVGALIGGGGGALYHLFRDRR